MRKRSWHYIHEPKFYEMLCDKCEGSNICWSEFKGLIWCMDCKIDTRGNEGIFSGPIPWGSIFLLLGRNCLDKYDMRRKRICYPRVEGNRLKWFHTKINKINP